MTDTEPQIDEDGNLAMTEIQKRAWKIGGCAIAVLCLAGTVSCMMEPSKTAADQADDAPAVASKEDGGSEADAVTVAGCGTGADVTKTDYAVDHEAPVLARPNAKAKTVKWTAANLTLDAGLDGSTDVRELCRKDGWSKVRVTVPQEMRSVKGWVPSSALAEVRTDRSGRRVYGKDDFEWPKGAGSSRAAVLTIIKRIVAQNPACDTIDRQSLWMIGSGKAATFTIGCTGDDGYQSWEFVAADATNGRSFVPEAPIAPVSKQQARQACRSAALQGANHPSTVEFSYLSESFSTFGNGGARFATDLTAKNSFNLELTYRAHCTFEGLELTNIELAEKR